MELIDTKIIHEYEHEIKTPGNECVLYFNVDVAENIIDFVIEPIVLGDVLDVTTAMKAQRPATYHYYYMKAVEHYQTCREHAQEKQYENDDDHGPEAA